MRPVAVRQHDDGTWYCRPYLGTNKVTGKPIRRYKRFPEASCEEEALAMAREWASGLSGAAELHTSPRLADVLASYIADREAKGSIRANTARAYRVILRSYIAPHIGTLDADEARPHVIEQLYAVLLARGGQDGKPLSKATVAQVHSFLCGAFKWIVRHEVAPFDPMPSVDPPRRERREARTMDGCELAALRSALDSVLSDPGDGGRASEISRTAAFAAFLSLWTGARLGEGLAVTVGAAATAAGVMRISSTVVEPKGGPILQERTKGGAGRNVSIGPSVCAAIARHIEWQRGFLPEAAADDRSRTLCCAPDGGLMRPSRVSSCFAGIRRGCGLPEGISFHTLRHTHAAWLLGHGVDMRTVQERLGHAKAETTIQYYGHVLPGRDRAAADVFEATVGEGGAHG